MSDQAGTCSDKHHFWSENVRRPTTISSTDLTSFYCLQLDPYLFFETSKSWIYYKRHVQCNSTLGGSHCTTRSTSGISSPLAATSVATKHLNLPSLKLWLKRKHYITDMYIQKHHTYMPLKWFLPMCTELTKSYMAIQFTFKVISLCFCGMSPCKTWQSWIHTHTLSQLYNDAVSLTCLRTALSASSLASILVEVNTMALPLLPLYTCVAQQPSITTSHTTHVHTTMNRHWCNFKMH